jgi:hypothetical protein
MKKTSRRRFGKQLTGALVSLPVMASVLEGQQQKPQEQKKTDIQVKFREHNTPPPMFLMPGSLIIEAATTKSDWDSFQQPQQTDRKKWSVIPKPYPNGNAPTNIYIAHIKILDGSGEMIHHVDNENTTDRATPIQLTASVYKNGNFFGDCILTPSGNHFELSVPNDKKIKQNNPNNDPSTNPGLRQRARFMHANNDEDFVFKALKIDKGTVNLFTESDMPTNFPGYSDLRVMVWWSNI